MRLASERVVLAAGFLAAFGCGTQDESHPAGTAGSGGATGSGGSMGSGATAGSATGGSSAATGGTTATGGSDGSGGSGVAGDAGGAGADAGPCSTPPAMSKLVGWAATNGGTTGGGTATPVTVTTAAELTSLAMDSESRVIYVKGSLTGSVNVGSNKTLVGLCGALLQGHIGISGSSNVIVRNLTIVGDNCADSPDDCSAGADAVGVGNGAHNIWFDHVDISDGSDGNFDINNAADFVTISWSKFHYSTKRTDPQAGASGHRFSNLIGSGDNVPGDVGHLNVTFHHNWWAENVDQRMPRTRYGKIHVFNNLFTSTGNRYCTNAGFQASLLVENNVYSGVNSPLSPDADGDMLARGNLFQNTNPANPTANGTGFVPDYQYTLDATANLAATIMSEAGPK